MLNLLLWGGVIAALIYYYVIKPLHYWKNRGVTQAKLSTALWDNFSPFLRLVTLPDFDTILYSRFKHLRYSGGYLLSMAYLIIHDPELIKQITVKDFDHFQDHQNLMPENVDPLWEKNLFVLQGQKWREMRPILSPSFTTSKMKSIFVIMSDSVQNFIEHFAAKKETILQLEMKDVFTRLGNDIIASTAFGVKVDSFAQPDNKFYRMGKKILDFGGLSTSIKFIIFIFFPRLAQIIQIRMLGRDVSNFFCNLINETIKTREENNIVRPDMLQLLMEAKKGNLKQEEKEVIDTGFATVQEQSAEKVSTSTGKRIEITNIDITAQAMIFFFAGFDSATNIMSFLAYELALNTDVQEKLRQEIKITDAACKGKLTYEALMQMKYLDMVVSECLRKWPNNVALDRVCTKPYTIQPQAEDEQTLHLDVGTRIHISVYGMHHHPDYWTNPGKFDPERFNEENKSKIIPYTYYPFGLGPRSCIASRFALMEVKTLFYHLVLNFEIVPTEKTPVPPVVSKYSCNITLKNGFPLALKRIRS